MTHAFAAHMALHMTLVAVIAPLLAWTLADTRFDPGWRWPRSGWASAWWPLLASVLEFVLVWGWHAPRLHACAGDHVSVFVVEQASFLAAGLLLWLAALGQGRRPSRERAAAGTLALLLTATHMTLLGVLLVSAPRVLYGHMPASAALALQDQQLGGVVMLAIGGVAYLLGALVLLRRLLCWHGGATA